MSACRGSWLGLFVFLVPWVCVLPFVGFCVLGVCRDFCGLFVVRVLVRLLLAFLVLEAVPAFVGLFDFGRLFYLGSFFVLLAGFGGLGSFFGFGRVSWFGFPFWIWVDIRRFGSIFQESSQGAVILRFSIQSFKDKLCSLRQKSQIRFTCKKRMWQPHATCKGNP